MGGLLDHVFVSAVFVETMLPDKFFNCAVTSYSVSSSQNTMLPLN
jgi:hypothetical protein